MPAIARRILTRRAHAEEIRAWAVQKGAQHQDTFGRGCAWYAGPSGCYSRFRRGLHRGLRSHRRIECRSPDRRQRLRQRCHHQTGRDPRHAGSNPAPQEPQGVARLRRISLPPATSRRKRIPPHQAVERHRNSLCKESGLISRSGADSMLGAVAENLVTTRSRNTKRTTRIIVLLISIFLSFC